MLKLRQNYLSHIYSKFVTGSFVYYIMQTDFPEVKMSSLLFKKLDIYYIDFSFPNNK